MIRFFENIVQRPLWQRLLLAVLLGVVSALALPPLNLWPMWFLTLPVILFVLRHGVHRWGQAFGLGWCFGTGYFLFAFHWIGYAFLVDKSTFLWMMPFAVGGLAMAMAIYWGLAFMLTHALGWRRLPQVFALAAALALAEWLRGRLLTGFPWAVPGLSVDGMGAVSQMAALCGMEGLTLFIILWAGAWPFLVWPRVTRFERGIAGLVMLSLLAGWGWGAWRLASHPTRYDSGVVLRLVQPAIAQSDKWRGDNMDKIFQQLLSLTALESKRGVLPNYIIWPEASIPFLIDESTEKRQELAQVLKPQQSVIAGSLRRIANPYNGEDKIFNAILIFSSTGKVVGHYDKRHLVPGGEFLPFAWLLDPLGFRRVVTLPGQFETGTGAQNLALEHGPPASFSICYEAIFPGGVVGAGRRPAWMINVTNDGWFGTSTGPYQHLAQARLRSIEQGLPMARAANTGISAIIDAYGREIATLPLEQAAILDAPLPSATDPTAYATWPNQIYFALLIITIMAGFATHYILRMWFKKASLHR